MIIGTKALAVGTLILGAVAVTGCDPETIAKVQAAQQAANAAAAERFAESRTWAAGAGPVRVRMCESRDNYAINTGNGYYGAWQFDYPSWHANGGGEFAAYPHKASKDQQDFVAWTYWKKAGWRPWSCKP
ncbi:MAG: hypothetical protein RLZ55_1577 [Actinomycetota bacterium]|jgi:hypothetical protein